MDSQIITISEKIDSHFKKIYPTSYDSIGLDSNKIYQLLSRSNKNLNNKSSLDSIIGAIDKTIQKKIHGPNVKKMLDEIKYTNDNSVNISYNNYLNNFNPSMTMDTPGLEKFQNILKVDGVVANEDKKSEMFKDVADKNGVLTNYQDDNPIRKRSNDIKEYFNDHNVKNISYLVIDSKDRNTEKFEFPNDYEVDLANFNINKIKSIELLDVIILKSDKDVQSSDSGTQYPYLLLEIEGLNSNIIGTNTTLNSSFAVLRKYELDEKYKYYNEINAKKEFKPAISLNKLRIKFKIPTGELFNFGFHNNTSIHTVNLLRFKIEHEN